MRAPVYGRRDVTLTVCEGVCQSARRDGDGGLRVATRRVSARLRQHDHRPATRPRPRHRRGVDCLLAGATTASHLEERVAKLLGRVVVDDRVDARVEVGQAAEEHCGGHVGAPGRVLADEEEGEQVDVNGQPEQCEQHDDEHQHSASVTLLVGAVTLLLPGAQRARRRPLHVRQVTQTGAPSDAQCTARTRRSRSVAGRSQTQRTSRKSSVQPAKKPTHQHTYTYAVVVTQYCMTYSR